MKKTALSLTYFLISFSIFSQGGQKIDSTYLNYFKNTREIPYLHLNKTSFLKGEEIWFKAYVLDLKTQKLHKKTTNLYCSLFDQNGVLKKQKLLYVKKGLVSGSFKIDSTYKNKHYYIKASTNYMKNYVEDESFIQKIRILNNKNILKKEDSLYKEGKNDFQLFPEGGHLLSNTQNSIGVSLKDNYNKGISILKGEIFDNENNRVCQFRTNKFGHGKFKIFIEDSKSYVAKIRLENGEEIVKELPAAKLKGLSLSINNQNPYATIVKIRTNVITLPNLIDKEYYFLIHNTRGIYKEKIVFNPNLTRYKFLIKNSRFQYGTNIITLFDNENRPIAERIFFNFKKDLLTSVKATASIREDSITLKLTKKGNDSIKYFLSASVLPFKTKSYIPSNSIYSKLFITPYIKGTAENSSYYFTNIDRKKRYELDLLFLTQGWSQYNWHSIFNSPPIERYSSGKGISLKGVINSKLPKNAEKVLLVSLENNIYRIGLLDKKTFEFNNLYLKEKSNINIAIIDSNNKVKKIKPYLRYFPKNNSTFVPVKPNYKVLKRYDFEINNDFILKDDSLLDEVVVEAKIKRKHNPAIPGIVEPFFPKNSHLNKLRLIDFLRFKGFNITEYPATFSINNRGKGMPRVFLDNISILDRDTNDLDIIYNAIVEDFEEIYISRILNGEVHLYSSTEPIIKKKSFPKYTSSIGYATNKKYYQPKYASTQNQAFKNYGAIYWKPNIIIEKDSLETSFKFNSQNQKEITILIEGITNTGSLISTKKTLKLKNSDALK